MEMDNHILTLFSHVLFFMIIKDVLCQPIDEENICLQHPGNNVVIANPNDCFSFYACQYGNAMKIICPNNVMFNPKLENCDPTYLDCAIDGDDDEALNAVTDKMDLLSEDMEQEGEDEDIVATNPDLMSEDMDEVDEDGESGVTNPDTEATEFVDSTTTTLFVSSSSNLPPDTTNVMSTVTKDPYNCETCSNPNPPLVQCPLNDTDTPSFLSSDLFCDSFYLCYHGRPFEMFCPVGFHWSQERTMCILERESNCADSSVVNKVPKCPLTGQFFIPHSERCNSFYYCENGIRSIQQCTPFKQWDVIEKACIFDIHAKCIKAIPRSQRAQYYSL